MGAAEVGNRTLSGRTAIVTGSSSGIGLAIARHFADAGAKVMMNGIEDEAELEDLLANLDAEHGAAMAYTKADLSTPEGVKKLCNAGEDRFGPIDILVNNAGVQHVSPIEDFPAAKWEFILALNLSAAFYAIQQLFSSMKERGWGRIINIASIHGLVASPYKVAYIAAKHGIVGLTKTIALEGAESGVTCNAICPGYVYTPLVEKQIDDQAKAHGIPKENVVREIILERQPSKRFVETEEIAAMALLLAGPSGASFNGAAIPIDGAWIAQ